MTDRRQRIIAMLEENLEQTAELYGSLDREALETPVYQDEVQWSVKQVLAHFVTIEKSMHWLFNDIIAGGPGTPEDFDLDRYNRVQPAKLDAHTAGELLEQFRALRQKTVDMVADMADSDLDREGRHAFHGHGKLERFIDWAHEHVDLHLADLRKALKA